MSWLNQIDSAICKSWPTFNLDPLPLLSLTPGREEERDLGWPIFGSY